MREAAGSEPGPSAAGANAQPSLKFRNYSVRDQKIEHTILEPAKAPEYEAPKPEIPEERAAQVRCFGYALLDVKTTSVCLYER